MVARVLAAAAAPSSHRGRYLLPDNKNKHAAKRETKKKASWTGTHPKVIRLFEITADYDRGAEKSHLMPSAKTKGFSPPITTLCALLLKGQDYRKSLGEKEEISNQIEFCGLD